MKLIGTKAMLISRDGLSAGDHQSARRSRARNSRPNRAISRRTGEFPKTAEVETCPFRPMRISTGASGPACFTATCHSALATYAERALIVLLVPAAVNPDSAMNFLPQLLRWRVRSRIYRWYGELALLERDVATRPGLAARKMVGATRPDRACRRANPCTVELRQRGVHATRAYRPGSPRGYGQGARW